MPWRYSVWSRAAGGGDSATVAAEASEALDAADEEMRDSELLTDLMAAFLRIPEKERGALADHLQLRDLRERRDQALGQAIREILLIGIAAQVLKRQHRDGVGRQGGRRHWRHLGGRRDRHRRGRRMPVAQSKVTEAEKDH